MNCSIDKIKKKLKNSQNVENTVSFSIIIPVYNTEKYLSRCLDSVVNQTFRDIEIIIVNDASQGNCKEIVEKYLKKDNRIKYIEHSENKSLIQARKTGNINSTGKYIMYVDSDDYLYNNNILKIILKKIKNLNYDIIFFDCILTDGENILPFDNWHSIPLYSMKSNEEIIKYFFSGNNHTMWGKLYKRELINKCLDDFQKIENITLYEDLIQNIIISYFANSSYSIHKIGYCYRINEDGSSKKKIVSKEDEEKLKKEIIIILNILNDFFIKYNLYEYYLYFLNTLKAVILNSYNRLNYNNHIFDYAKDILPEEMKLGILKELIFNNKYFNKIIKKNNDEENKRKFAFVIGTRKIQIILFGLKITLQIRYK